MIPVGKPSHKIGLLLAIQQSKKGQKKQSGSNMIWDLWATRAQSSGLAQGGKPKKSNMWHFFHETFLHRCDGDENYCCLILMCLMTWWWRCRHSHWSAWWHTWPPTLWRCSHRLGSTASSFFHKSKKTSWQILKSFLTNLKQLTVLNPS